jgi:hypothetical protein
VEPMLLVFVDGNVGARRGTVFACGRCIEGDETHCMQALEV